MEINPGINNCMGKQNSQESNETIRDRLINRLWMLRSVQEYLGEMILHCEDEEDLKCLGALLQVQSKNILTSTLSKAEWKYAISQYVIDTLKEPNQPSVSEILKNLGK
jgi:hypothetical protein